MPAGFLGPDPNWKEGEEPNWYWQEVAQQMETRPWMRRLLRLPKLSPEALEEIQRARAGLGRKP